MIVSTHQPGYLPWLGLIDKIARSDVFVVLDQVQFNKRAFQHRTLIKTPRGAEWLTIPVLAKGHQTAHLEIREIPIDLSQDFQQTHYKTLLHNYRKAPYWQDHLAFLQGLYLEQQWPSLMAINLETIQYTLQSLGITTPLVMASELQVTGTKSDLILNICQAVGAKTYLSGVGAKDYMQIEDFNEAGITVIYQEFIHPVYPQLHGEFVSGLSALDLVFNCGGTAPQYLTWPQPGTEISG